MVDNRTEAQKQADKDAYRKRYPREEDLPGWREISEADFSTSMFFHYSPADTGYAQLSELTDPDNPASYRRGYSAQIFYYHDGTGLGVRSDWERGKIRFYKFGCEHKYRELSTQQCRERKILHHGNCWHVNECQVCGHIRSYDSSG